jgi:dUTP pyrophosphatase
MSSPTLYVKSLTPNTRLPEYKTEHAAGLDIYCPYSTIIHPGEVVKVRTGFAVRIPHGHYGRIASRSSLALKGIVVEAGVIDCDYSDEIIVLLRNVGKKSFAFNVTENPDLRIAQLIIEKNSVVKVETTNTLPDTDSNRTGGFGSTDNHENSDSE